MKNLTVEQNDIINKIVSEFETINTGEKCLNKTIVDAIFEKANKKVLEREDFYLKIKENNDRIRYQANELASSFKAKLEKLFENYPMVKISGDDLIVIVAISDGTSRQPKRFHVSIQVKLTRNERNGSISFCFENDQSLPRVEKYLSVIAVIDGTYVNLSDFEETEVFQTKVFELFTANL